MNLVSLLALHQNSKYVAIVYCSRLPSFFPSPTPSLFLPFFFPSSLPSVSLPSHLFGLFVMGISFFKPQTTTKKQSKKTPTTINFSGLRVCQKEFVQRELPYKVARKNKTIAFTRVVLKLLYSGTALLYFTDRIICI